MAVMCASTVATATERCLARPLSYLRFSQPAQKPCCFTPESEHLPRRVARASIEEIDRVILELQGVRDMLRSEGERVSREITSYASLNQHLTTGMKVVAENLMQWQRASVSHEQLMAEFKLRCVGGSGEQTEESNSA